MQAKAITAIEQRAQREEQRAEETGAQLKQLQEALSKAEAASAHKLTTLGMLMPLHALSVPPCCL